MKISPSSLVHSILAFILLSSMLLVGLTSSIGVYDPWLDTNNDGKIDMRDIGAVARLFGTSGEPLDAKAAVLYDSGWINITDLRGKHINVTHGLNITNWHDQNMLLDVIGSRNVPGLNPDILRLGELIDPYNVSWGWNVPKKLGTLGGVGNCIIQTKDGGYAIAGSSDAHDPLRDFYLVKANMWGDFEWENWYGTTNREGAYSVIQLEDEGFLIAGYSDPGGDEPRVHLVRTDKYGDVGAVGTWERTYETAWDAVATSVVEAWNGGYVFAGYGVAYGYRKFYWVEIDEAGNVLSGEHFDFNGELDKDETCNCLIRTSDGGYALAGTGFGDLSFLLVKIDGPCNYEWRYQGGLQGENTQCTSVVQIDDNVYMMAGYTNHFYPYNYDFYTVKVVYSESGVVADGRTYWREMGDNEYDEKAYAIVKSRFGGCAIAGSNSFGIWMIKTDDARTYEWPYEWVEVHAGASSIIETADGGLAMTGKAGGFVFLLKLSRFYTPPQAIWIVNPTPITLVIYRNIADPNWNYIRIRILKLG